MLHPRLTQKAGLSSALTDAPVPSPAEASIFWVLCNTAEDAPRVIFVTGSPSAGKTATLERVLARFAETSTEILRWHPSQSMPARLRSVLVSHVQHAATPQTPDGPAAIVIVIDDAHRMPVETIRVLRRAVMSGAQQFPVLRLLLVGGPALLAALPRSTPFRLPGGSCIHIRISRVATTRTRKTVRRTAQPQPRPAHPTARKRKTIGNPGVPKVTSYKGTATGLLLIAVLVFALIMGDRLTPGSMRPALSKLSTDAETTPTQSTLPQRPPTPPAPRQDAAALVGPLLH